MAIPEACSSGRLARCPLECSGPSAFHELALAEPRLGVLASSCRCDHVWSSFELMIAWRSQAFLIVWQTSPTTFVVSAPLVGYLGCCIALQIMAAMERENLPLFVLNNWKIMQIQIQILGS